MKTGFLVTAAIFLLLLAACEDDPIRPSCWPVLPELPRHWKEILGEPRWRLEWIGGEGSWLEWEGNREAPEFSLSQEWTSPVLAWPFWPARDLLPGMMRPAGALFPWDAAGDRLKLSWEGGPVALFWKELAQAER